MKDEHQDPEKRLTPDETIRVLIFINRGEKAGGSRAALIAMSFHLLLGTGLRNYEAINLKLSDIHIGHDERYIYVRRGKGGKTRSVEISKHLKQRIKRYVAKRKHQSEYLLVSERAKPFTRDGIRKSLKRVYKAVGIADHHATHTLRHTHLTAFQQRGQDIIETNKRAGHARLETTMIYIAGNNEKVQLILDAGLYT